MMTPAAHDPRRFQPYREPLRTTLIRTGLIAVGLASIVTPVQLSFRPGDVGGFRTWLAWSAFFLWISLGGHCVELAYLNALRPRIARWSDRTLVLVRLAVWMAGGPFLFIGALTSQRLISLARLPNPQSLRAALYFGGPLFAVIELLPHAVLAALRRPSFWNARG